MRESHAMLGERVILWSCDRVVARQDGGIAECPHDHKITRCPHDHKITRWRHCRVSRAPCLGGLTLRRGAHTSEGHDMSICFVG